ncbi:MAG: HIT domain-containing protein [Candidatus Peribacteria bacterium]|jgi:diadenosine tetraphosphate (Ap4A) HIT family hydrolase|nr:HIT domain-containing protein [Candidatus Peribacteria bacterium]
MEIRDYCGNTLSYKGDCPACAYANHEFSLPCGIAYEDAICTISQDWELPINGMFVVAPKRHINAFSELTKEERVHLFEMVNVVIKILKKNNIANDFNVIFEEKNTVHFHIWIFPRDGRKEKGIDPLKEIGKMKQYALNENRNNDIYIKIIQTTNLLRGELQMMLKQMN